MKNIILASSSPRRRDILRNAGLGFEIAVPSYEENILNKSFSYELVENTALNKGISVMRSVNKEGVIVSADTVVVYDNIILGKPKNYDDALRMLKMLSNNTHKVVTAVCVIDTKNEKPITKSETSEVTFNRISNEEIADYITKFKPYDKAGAYGIQELNCKFVKEIKGSYDNIVGLPLSLLINLLKEAYLL